MTQRIQTYSGLLDHAFELALKADNLQEAIQDRRSPQEVNQLTLDVVALACEIAISDLFQALKPPDELPDPDSETP